MKPGTRRIVGRTLGHVLRVASKTWRARIIGPDEVLPHRSDRRQRVVYGVWHRDILIASTLCRDLGMVAGASEHGDGDLAAHAAMALGFKIARGSSTRGAVRLLREMLRYARETDADLTLASDGPRGPAQKTKPGVVYLAGRLGWPLVPLGVAARGVKELRSWDRFRVPLPCCKLVLAFGEPLEIPRKMDESAVESLAREMDRRMAECETIALDASRSG